MPFQTGIFSGDNETKICGIAKLDCSSEALEEMNSEIQEECDCWPACTSIEYPRELEQFQLKTADRKQFNERLV